jgi:hypothetical protein
VDGVSTLASKITDLTDSPAMVMLVEMDGRVFAVGRQPHRRIRRGRG